MNIVFIVDTLNSGGKERRLVELLMELVSRKELLPILILTEGLNSNQAIDYKYLLEVDVRIYYLGNINKLNLSKEIIKICIKESIDLINIWSPIVYTYLIYPSK